MRPICSVLLLMFTMPIVVSAQDSIDEVRQLADHPTLERAFEIIEELEPRTISDLIKLTQVAAPPFMEEKRAAVYAEWLAEAGADSVFIDDEGNGVAIRFGLGGERGQTTDGEVRTVAISGQLDTVFPDNMDVTVTQRGDTVFAPGIGDDTRGLVSVLTVLRALEGAGIETQANVRLIGVVGEEGVGDEQGGGLEGDLAPRDGLGRRLLGGAVGIDDLLAGALELAQGVGEGL